MRKIAFLLVLVSLVLFGCGGDEPEETKPPEAATPAATPAESPETPTESPSEDTSGATGTTDVDALIAELEACLNEGGIETESEKADLPIYDEKATIDLTFKYPQITVPGAVTLWVYDSPEAAAKGKKAIDDNLLEGDTETLLSGQVVIDDFGNTLETPEAAEQAEILESCTA